MKTYKSSQIAEMFKVHPNTVRLYEDSGFISKAERLPNNYRNFTELHVIQMKICRNVFGCPFTNHHIRSEGVSLLRACGNNNLKEAGKYLQRYTDAIQNEIDIAETALNSLYDFVNCETINNNDIFSRKQAADMFGITIEALRNWERNDLIHGEKIGKLNKVYFNNNHIKRIRIIYMLRQSGYSMSAIYRCLMKYDNGCTEDINDALNNPNAEEILSTGDRWLSELKRVKEKSKELRSLLCELEKIIK